MPVSLRLLAAATLVAAVSVPASAGSLATSSAAGGSSASSAASESSESSVSSSQRVVAAADGPYRVVEVAPVPERPQHVRVTLLPLADGAAAAPLRLLVPQRALERGGVAAGTTVVATQRPYGVAFAHADTRRAFFLVVNDDVHRELRSTPVAL